VKTRQLRGRSTLDPAREKSGTRPQNSLFVQSAEKTFDPVHLAAFEIRFSELGEVRTVKPDGYGSVWGALPYAEEDDPQSANALRASQHLREIDVWRPPF
jgi:hypothetical protein